VWYHAVTAEATGPEGQKGPHAMNKLRVPPSEEIRQQIDQLLRGGTEGGVGALGALVQLGAQVLVQEALERETAERLGRAHYQRRTDDEPLRGYRNGYEPGRLRTAEGEITVQIPQVRDWAEGGPYRSRLMTFLRGHSDVLDSLAVEMYARGLSVRDIEDAFRDATGDTLLSRSAVSELTEALWEDYQAFCVRDLSIFEVEYVFIDAIYEGLRAWGGHQGILCAWAICRDGRRVMLHLALGSRESYENSLDFIRNMVGRGLNVPVMVTTDGAPGLMRAVSEVWGKSLRQRCLAHKMRNILDKVPRAVQEEIKRRVQDVFYAPSLDMARERAADVLRDYQAAHPSAMRAFSDDLEACLAYLRCPAAHHKAIRTTNLLERAFGESRRRTKVIPHFFTEEACLKLVFASLWQSSRRWRRVTMTELEQQQLALLRHELGAALA
jgi:transposase-like protein